MQSSEYINSGVFSSEYQRTTSKKSDIAMFWRENSSILINRKKLQKSRNNSAFWSLVRTIGRISDISLLSFFLCHNIYKQLFSAWRSSARFLFFDAAFSDSLEGFAFEAPVTVGVQRGSSASTVLVFILWFSMGSEARIGLPPPVISTLRRFGWYTQSWVLFRFRLKKRITSQIALVAFIHKIYHVLYFGTNSRHK